MKAISPMLEELSGLLKETSLCGLGLAAPNPVLSTLRHFRDEYEAHVRERRCPAGHCRLEPAGQLRRCRHERQDAGSGRQDDHGAGRRRRYSPRPGKAASRSPGSATWADCPTWARAACAWWRSKARRSCSLPASRRWPRTWWCAPTRPLQAHRKLIVELLFAERNHVCSVCVLNGACELQELAAELGVDHIRLAPQYPKLTVDLSHERFGLDHNRCILCTRCVRVCDEVEGAHTWDVAGPRPNSRASSPISASPGANPIPAPAAASACRCAPPALCSSKGKTVAEMRKDRSFLQIHHDRPGEEAVDRVTRKPQVSRRPGWAAARAATCRSSIWTSA